ncbi:MAG: DNA-binding response regulator [Bacteroidetes bacterium]|nr:MAG: DNA-binding response regulator [Bacteroidota bacterium]
MRVLIVEDEPAAARRLEKMLREVAPDAEVAEVLDSIEGVVAWWQTHEPPDLVLLDIHLADGSSFEIFDQVAVSAPVIFTTAYDQYAVDAFRVNAVDYLLKPIKREELQRAIERYRQQTAAAPLVDYRELARAMRGEAYPRRFLIRRGQTIKVVGMDEVAYFYTEDKITFLTTKEGRRYPIDYSLEKLEEMLDGARFFRINRQFIISIDSIREMYAYSKARVKVELVPPTDHQTIVSTERSPHFKRWLKGIE